MTFATLPHTAVVFRMQSSCCSMYIPFSDDKPRFVQKVHSARANGHWEHGRNSNPVATLPNAAVVLYATI